MDEIRRHPESRRAGAMATFVGIVREDPVESSSSKVRYLEYEAFEEVATQKLQKLRDDLTKREGIVDVSIHHVVDRLGVGDESLIIAVLGTRRRFVFPILEEAVERVKKEVRHEIRRTVSDCPCSLAGHWSPKPIPNRVQNRIHLSLPFVETRGRLWILGVEVIKRAHLRNSKSKVPKSTELGQTAGHFHDLVGKAQVGDLAV
jgi:molybdopterin synthase catalytic subunit